jgi:hypothetical protein
MIYENDFCIKDAKNIYAFSDIHGDFGVLICCLRDCAKVIKQKNGTNWNDLVKDEIPLELFDKSSEYIIRRDTDYDCLYGFEWIGGDSIVVITGDLIDNFRSNEFYIAHTIFDVDLPDKIQFEIHQEELKIMIFLRELSRNAQQYGGNIITIIGNHDHVNSMNNRSFIKQHTSPLIRNAIYYDNIERSDIFSLHHIYHTLFNNYVFHKNKLVMSNYKTIIFKVNDFIFMHGGMNSITIQELYKRYQLNTPSLNSFIRDVNLYYNMNINDNIWKDPKNSILWSRDLGSYFESEVKHDEFCNNITENIFNIICKNDKTCFDKKYIVIGHCPQSETIIIDSIYYNTKENALSSKHDIDKLIYNYTHSIVKKDNDRDIISGPIQSYTYYDQDYLQNIPFLSGITGICPNKENIAKVYRIDVAMSRSYDLIKREQEYIKRKLLVPLVSKNTKEITDSIIKLLYIFFLSRAPQILHINYNNQIKTSLIRANLKTMLSSVKRNNYFFRTNDNGEVYDLSDEFNNNIDLFNGFILDKKDLIYYINKCVNYIDNLPQQLNNNSNNNYYDHSSYKYRSKILSEQEDSIYENLTQEHKVLKQKAKKYKTKYEQLLQQLK